MYVKLEFVYGSISRICSVRSCSLSLIAEVTVFTFQVQCELDLRIPR